MRKSITIATLLTIVSLSAQADSGFYAGLGGGTAESRFATGIVTSSIPPTYETAKESDTAYNLFAALITRRYHDIQL